MSSSYRETPTYDAYELDNDDGPPDIYVNQLQLVLADDRILIVDETNPSEIYQQVARWVPGSPDIAIRPLTRGEAAVFARYMDWDATCDALPPEHPIHVMTIPEMPTQELDASDPRLHSYDFAAIRAGFRAQMDQTHARSGRYHSRTPEPPDEDLPPLD